MGDQKGVVVILTKGVVFMKLGNFKIGLRLTVGFSLLILMMSGILAAGLYQMKVMNTSIDRIVNVNNLQIKLSNDMLDEVNNISRHIRNILIYEDMTAQRNEVTAIEEAIVRYNSAATQLSQMIDTDTGQQLFDDIAVNKEESTALNQRVIDLALGGESEEALRVMIDQAEPEARELTDDIFSLIAYAEGITDMRYQESQAGYAAAVIFMLVIGGLAFILGGLIAYFITRSITIPLNELSKISDTAASGDLTVDVKVNTKDEVGMLADSLRKMINQMREVVGEIVIKSKTVGDASEQLNSNSQQTAASANETSATMSEIATTVEQTVSNIEQISAASEVASEHADKGGDAITRVTAQMQSIADSTGRVSKSIEGLNTKSNEINQIINLITSIAEQTNLLALNAAIEAARAGDQGRGFAVVAEEVRKLAEQSASAAKDIYTLINDMQTESEKAVATMGESNKEVHAGSQVVSEVGDSFKEIISSIQTLTSQIQDVASATEQMSAGVQNVAASTEQQTAAMEEVSASAESLSKLSEDLNALVGRFRV